MWIHVPPTSSVSAQDTGGSSLDSTLPWVAELARSVTWKTNSVSPASLRRVWKTVPSIQLLSGLTSAPSIQSRGVAEWISSLEASPANRTASQGASSEKMTQGNSAEKSLELRPDLDTQLSFLKMSPESLDSTGTPYDPNYERWVTKLRKDSSRRQKLAHLTGGSGSLSWPTATTNSATYSNGQRGPNLIEAATNWPTPSASSGGTHTGITEETARKELERGNQIGLGAAAAMWPTPRAIYGEHPGMTDESHLTGQAIKNWPTPATRDYKGFDPPGKQNTKNDPEMYLSIPQAPTTEKDGHTCSPSCRRLNPRFAEMLMGLPPGWTDDSEPLATESFQQWQHSLSENLQGGDQ